MKNIVVLQDGETWEELCGAESYVVSVSDWMYKKLCNGYYPKHFRKAEPVNGIGVEFIIDTLEIVHMLARKSKNENRCHQIYKLTDEILKKIYSRKNNNLL